MSNEIVSPIEILLKEKKNNDKRASNESCFILTL